MSDQDWLADQVQARREREAKLAAEVADLAGDAPAPVQAEAQPQPSNVVQFRLPTPWPHAWNSPEPWRGKGWNSGRVWQGKPRVLITNRSAKPPGDDEPPTPPMAA